IGFWPAGFDSDGVMYCNTAFGDYPHYLPHDTADHLESRFTGWMLLNYQKPVKVSSSLSGHPPNHAVDEDIKTYWSAETGGKDEWFETDLGAVSEVFAIQINYADHDVDRTFLGKSSGVCHHYSIWPSPDGAEWPMQPMISTNTKAVPNDYVELPVPVSARILRMENIRIPTGTFALSGFRVFGKGPGEPPAPVSEFLVLRTAKDKRSAWIKWKPASDAFAYNIYYGTAADKLYNCIMVYGANEYWFKGMDRLKPYFFTIESINENGVSARFPIVRAE